MYNEIKILSINKRILVVKKLSSVFLLVFYINGFHYMDYSALYFCNVKFLTDFFSFQYIEDYWILFQNYTLFQHR